MVRRHRGGDDVDAPRRRDLTRPRRVSRLLALLLVARLVLPGDVGTMFGAVEAAAAETTSTGSVDLSLTATPTSTTVVRGGTATVHFTLMNSSTVTDTATSVSVGIAVGSGLSFASADLSGASGTTFDSGTSTWTVGSLAPGASVTLGLSYTADDAVRPSSTITAAVATVDQTDVDPANDSATMTVDAVEADLELGMSTTIARPLPNEQPVVTLTLANVATATAASNVTVDVSFEAGLSVAPGTEPAGYSGGVWTVGDLAAGASTSIQLTLDVGSAAVGGADVAAEVSAMTEFDVDSIPGNGSTTEDDDAAVTIDPMASALTVTKTVSPTDAAVGTQAVFTVRVSNAGPDPATGVVVTDPPPEGTTFVSADTGGAGTYDAATGIWNIGPIAVGSTVTLTLTVTIDQVGVTNTATITAVDQFDTSGADTASASVSSPNADVAVTLTDPVGSPLPTTADVGDRFTIVVHAANGSTDTTTSGVTVEEVLPAGLALVGRTLSQGTFAGTTWDVGSIAPASEVTMSVEVEVTADATSGATYTATRTASTPADGNSSNDSASHTVTALAADLSLTGADASGTVAVGATTSVRFTLTNAAGGDDATGVTVGVVVPDGLTVTGSTASLGTYATGVWDLTGVTVAAGSAPTLDLQVTVDADGDRTETVTAQVATSDRYDPDSLPGGRLDAAASEDDEATASVTTASADLSLAWTQAPVAPNVDDPVDFELTLANDGSSLDAATGVTVAVSLPSGLRSVTVTPGAGTFDAATGTWTVPGPIAPGSAVTLAVAATIDVSHVRAPTAASATAEVTASGQTDPDSDPANGAVVPAEDDLATATYTVPETDLALAVAVASTSSTTPAQGDSVTFDVTLDNTVGPSDGTAVRVELRLPADLTYGSASAPSGTTVTAPPAGSGGTVVWDVPTIAAGTTAVLSVTTTVTGSTLTDIVVVGEVVAAPEYDPDSVPGNDMAGEDDQDSAGVNVPDADLAVTVTTQPPFDTAPPDDGDTVALRVEFTNNGEDAATGTSVAITIPAGLRYAADTPGQGSYDPSNGIWSVGDLAAGTTASLDLGLTVALADSLDPISLGADGVVGGGDDGVAVTATVQHGPQVDPVAGNDVDTERIRAAAADASVTIAVSDPAPDVGDTVTLTVTVANAGPDPLDPTVVVTMPTGLTVTSDDGGGTFSSTTGTWQPPDVAAAGSATLVLQVLVGADATTGGEIVAELTDAAGRYDIDSTPGNGAVTPAEDDRAVTTVTAASADLSVVLALPADGTTDVGESATATVTVANAGPDDAVATIVLTLPDGLVAVAAADGGVIAGSFPTTITWTGVAVPAGTTTTPGAVTLSATVQPTAAATTPGADGTFGTGDDGVAVTADITTSDRYDPTTTDHTTTVRFRAATADAAVALAVTGTTTPRFGDPTAVALTASNAGPEPTEGLAVTLTADPGLTMDIGPAPQGTVSGTTWTTGPIAAGGSAVLELTVTGTAGGTQSLTAEVTAASRHDRDSTPGNGPQDTDPFSPPDTEEDDLDVVVVTVDEPASVTGRVWDDRDGDGVDDGGTDEPGLAGVGITLFTDADDDPATADEVVLAGPVLTDANGDYTVSGLPRDDVRVAVTGPPGSPYEASTPTSVDLVLAAGQDATVAPFGYWRPNTIIVTVFEDLDGSGTHDATEGGLENIEVTVSLAPGESSDLPFPRTALTGSDGVARFPLLPPGQFVVDVAHPAGYIHTTGPDPLTTDPVTTDPLDVATEFPLAFGYQRYAPEPALSPATQQRDAEASTTAAFPVTVSNAGNVEDTYDLTVTSPWTADVVIDADGDGIWDPVTEPRSGAITDTGVLARGEQLALFVLVDVPVDTPRGTIEDTTLVAASRIDATVTATAILTTQVVAPVLDIALDSGLGGAGFAIPGETVDHTVTITNAAGGDVATATQLELHHELTTPEHGEVVDGSIAIDGVVQPTAVFPLELGDLAPGSTRVVTYTLRVARPLADGTGITTIVTAGGSNPRIDRSRPHVCDPAAAGLTTPWCITDAVTDIVDSAPIPVLVVTAVPATTALVEPGDVITYTATITNREDATDTWHDVELTVEHAVPSGAYVPGSVTVSGDGVTSPGPVADGPGGSSPLAGGLSLPDLAPGGQVIVTYQVAVRDPVPDGATLTDLAVADGSNGGPLLAATTHTVRVVHGVTVTPDRTASGTAPAEVVYAHVVRNTGNVTDTFAVTAATVRGTSVRIYDDTNANGRRDANEGLLPATVTLAPGGQRSIVVVVAIPEGTLLGLVDDTTVSATSLAVPTIRGQAFDRFTVTAPVLRVGVAATPSSSAVNPGQAITYTITVRNEGTASLAAANLVDDTPAQTTYQRGSVRRNGVPVPDRTGGDGNPLAAVNGGLGLGTLDPAEVERITFDVVVQDPVPASTVVTNVASVTAAGPVTVTDSVSQVVTATSVLDVRSSSVPPEGTVVPGQIIDYSITVRNVGSTAATGTVAFADTPALTTYVPGSARLDGGAIPDAGTSDGNPFDHEAGGVSLGTLAAGAPVRTLAYRVRVLEQLIDGAAIRQTADVTTAEGVTGASPELLHTVALRPAVTMSSAPPVATEAPGHAVFAHVVTNGGNGQDTFQLMTQSSRGWNVSVYEDEDGNGTWDPTRELAPIVSTGPVPAGGSTRIFVVVEVPAAAPTGTVDETVLTATSAIDHGIRATVRDHTSVVAPKLSVVIAADPSGDQVNAGQTIRYVVIVSNRGTSPAAGVRVTDAVPAGTAYVAGSATVNGGTIADAPDGNPFAAGYGLGTIAAGQAVSVGFAVRVPTTASTGTVIVDRADVVADGVAPSSASRTHTVTPGPVLDLQIAADPPEPGPVAPAGTIRYTTAVRNVGQDVAPTVRLIHDTPLQTRFVPGSARLGGEPFPDGPTDPNPFSSVYGGLAVGDLPTGGAPVELSFTVEVLDPIPVGTEITTSASALAADGTSATATEVVHALSVTAGVSVTPDGSSSTIAGSTVAFPHTVANLGDVTDVYDLFVESGRGWDVRITRDLDGDGAPDPDEPLLHDTGELGPGQELRIVVAVDVPPGAVADAADVLVVTARSTLDPVISDTATDVVSVVGRLLSLRKSARPLSLVPGTVTTYTLEVVNASALTATDVVLTDPVPAGTTYVPGSTQIDGASVADDAGTTPLATGMTLPDIPAGSTVVASFQALAEQPGDRTLVTNVAEVTAAGLDPVQAGTVQPIDGTFGLDLDPGAQRAGRPGTEVVHPHVLTNLGLSPDEAVLVTSSDNGFDVRIHLDLDADGALGEAEPVVGEPVALSAGGSQPVLVVVAVPAGAPGGLVDTVELRATSVSAPHVSVAVEDRTIVAAPRLDLQKRVSPTGTAPAGGILEYTLDVVNAGASPVVDLVLLDLLPAEVELLAGSVTRDGQRVPGETDLFVAPGLALGSLAPNARTTLTFAARVRPETTTGTVVSNNAELRGPGLATLRSNPAVVTVGVPSALRITKRSATGSEVAAGDVVTWVVTIENTGAVALAGVVLTDPPPAGTSYLPGTARIDGLPVSDEVVVGDGWTFASIEPGAAHTLVFQTVAEVDGTQVENIARVDHLATSAVVLSNLSAVTVTGPRILPATGAQAIRTLSLAAVSMLSGWVLLYVARPQRTPEVVRPWPMSRRPRNRAT